MIATGDRKFPAALARTVGESLIELLRPYCVDGHLEICGSLRRGKAEVGDVEICYISKVGDVTQPGDFFSAPGLLADVFINELLVDKLAQRLSEDGLPTWGSLNKLALHRATGIPVDLFREARVDDWPRTLVIRTGPRDFNLRVIEQAARKGLKVHAYGTGLTDESGGAVPCATEQEFLETCGIGWIEPKDRK